MLESRSPGSLGPKALPVIFSFKSRPNVFFLQDIKEEGKNPVESNPTFIILTFLLTPSLVTFLFSFSISPLLITKLQSLHTLQLGFLSPSFLFHILLFPSLPFPFILLLPASDASSPALPSAPSSLLSLLLVFVFSLCLFLFRSSLLFMLFLGVSLLTHPLPSPTVSSLPSQTACSALRGFGLLPVPSPLGCRLNKAADGQTSSLSRYK